MNILRFSRGPILAATSLILLAASASRGDDSLPIVTDVEQQPFKAQVERVVQALELAGVPLSEADQTALQKAVAEQDASKSIPQIRPCSILIAWRV